MTEINKVSLELLDELDAFCDENGLSYFLAGGAALNAHVYGEINRDIKIMEVFMPYHDILKFQSYINDNCISGRTVESIYTNPDLTKGYFKYVNCNTLYYNALRDKGFKALGIYIRIIGIMNSNLKDRKASAMLEAWRQCRTPNKAEEWLEEAGSFDRYKRERFYKQILKDKEAFRTGMLTEIEASQKKYSPEKVTYINKPKGNAEIIRNYFPAGMFSAYDKIPLEGHYYRIPKDVEQYLTAQYKGDMDRIAASVSKESLNIVYSVKVPFERYIERLKEKDIALVDANKAIKAEKKSREFYLTKDMPINEVWHKLQRDIAVNKLVRQFAENKEEVLKSYSEGDWDRLGEIFAEYDFFVRRIGRYGMSVHVDREIKTIYIEWLKHSERADFAEFANSFDVVEP